MYGNTKEPKYSVQAEERSPDMDAPDFTKASKRTRNLYIGEGDGIVLLSVLPLRGAGRLEIGRGVSFPRSQSPSRPVSAPFCAMSALY